MSTFNKEMKNKALMLKMNNAFLLFKTYYKTNGYLDVKEAFHRRFSVKDPPKNRPIWKTVKNTKEKEQV